MPTLIKKLFGSRKTQTKPQQEKVNTSAAKRDLPDWSDKASIKASLDMLAALDDVTFTEWLAEQQDPAILAHVMLLPDPKRREKILDHVLALYTSAPEPFRSALDKALETPESHLGNLFRALPPEEIQHLLSSQPVSRLKSLALEHPAALIRETAARLIQGQEGLEYLAKHSKGKDKTVYQIARQRLRVLREAEEKANADRARAKELLAAMKQLAETTDEALYSGRVSSAMQQWETLPETVRDAFRDEWQALADRCLARIEQMRAEEEAARAAQETSQRKQREREQTLLTLEQTIEDLKLVRRPDAARVSALDALCKTQETRWLEASHHEAIDKAEQKRYLAAMGLLHHYLLACKRLLEHEAEVERLIASTDAEELVTREKTLRKIAEDVRWPTEFPLPEQLEAIQNVIGRIETRRSEALEDEKKRLEKARNQLAKLETLIDEGHLRKARRIARDVGHQLNLLPDRKTQSLRAELTRLTQKLRDLEDWKGFATRPKLEELIERMRHLAGHSMEPHAKAEAIRALQQEWRDLGGTPDQSLWHAFQEAAETAYQPLKAFFEEEARLKAANLEKRQEIIEQLSRFLEDYDWTAPDWKLVDTVNRKAREEWRACFPVDPRKGRKLQKQFNALLSQLDEKLDAERTRNEKLKEDIVQRAAALVNEPDVKVATREAKALQKEWEQVGITHYKRDRALWKAFRGHCDAIFARLGEARKAEEEALHAQKARAEELLDALQSLSEETDPGALEAASDRLRSEFTELRLHPRDAQALQARYRDIVKTLETRLQALRRAAFREHLEDILDNKTPGTLLPADADRSPEDSLLLLEILAGTESPSDERERRMVLQVERLNAGLKGAVPDDTATQFESLLARLARDPDFVEARRQRLNAAVESFCNQKAV